MVLGTEWDGRLELFSMLLIPFETAGPDMTRRFASHRMATVFIHMACISSKLEKSGYGTYIWVGSCT